MSDKVSRSFSTFRVIPFTGPIFAIWAFFGPESFGTWFGTILHGIRTAGGF